MEAKFQKEKHTLLMPGLFPIHMEFLAAAIRASGYRVKVLSSSGRSVLNLALGYIHNDMCYPAMCSVGQQLYALTSGEFDPDEVALIQFQTGGGCRASNYASVLKKALEKLGLDRVPIVTFGFSNLARGSGFSITPLMCQRLLAALTYGDLLMLLSNQLRPYERQPGAVQTLAGQWRTRLQRELASTRSGLSQVRANLKQMVKAFADIPIQVRKKVKVGIVGEVYVKYSPFANNNLEALLQSQDCEYMLPGVLGFIHYCLTGPAVDWELYGGSRLRHGISLTLGRIVQRYETALARALAPFPQFHQPPSFRAMREMGERVLSRGVKMGEGWYLPAEMVELIESGYSNILCAQPFGCLPNHIVGRGTMRKLRDLYPTANIMPLDYDPGLSQVNQENRIKLLLANGRPRPDGSIKASL